MFGGFLENLGFLHQANTLSSTAVALLSLTAMGTALGFFVDWLGRKAGVDTSPVKHHHHKPSC